jgi:hypothetical protein
MKRIFFAVFIVVSRAWNTNGILTAQPTKIGNVYSRRGNSMTPFHPAGRYLRFFVGEKFKMMIARKLI